MIIFTIILLVVSFLLQGILSNFLAYISGNISIFSTIYILITLLLVYPYFENKRKFLIVLVIFGWLVDVVYTNTFLLNISLFYLIYKFSSVFHFFLPYNLFTINVSNLLGVFIYHVLSFILLSLLGFDNYSWMMLAKVLGCNIIMTVVYTTISYLGICYLKDRCDLKEVK